MPLKEANVNGNKVKMLTQFKYLGEKQNLIENTSVLTRKNKLKHKN